MFENLTAIVFGSIILLAVAALAVAMMLRRVVPTNMVHIVQYKKKTVAYGRGKEAGNVYFEFPAHIPVFGVTVTKFPESIFKVPLDGYDAYDSARLPFVVDVVGFFRVEQPEIAAQRIPNFEELIKQLTAVLQGSVRRVLAKNPLEEIMEARSSLGELFTSEVRDQLKEWGVVPVKTIEFMDIRDQNGSQVIQQIMAKEKSRISMESRVKIAENEQLAKTKEIETARQIEINSQDAAQQVGLRTAEKDQAVGIANEQAKQQVIGQAKVTTEKEMEVKQVSNVRTAEIAKEVANINAEQDKQVAEIKAEKDKNVRIINTEAEKQSKIIESEGTKQSTVTVAEGDLEAAKRSAEATRTKGIAAADAERAMLQAPVDTQIALAQEIGSNAGYQQYLITIEQIKANQVVGVQMADAIKAAQIKVIANSGDIQGGVSNVAEMFTPKGGTNIAGMLSAIAQTEEGRALVNKFITPKE